MESSGVKWVRLGDYIEWCDERNTKEMYSVDDVRGISIEKRIIDTKANMDGVSVTNYKLYRTNYFCYVPVTSRNGNKITLALNTYDATYIVSSAYEVFRVKDEVELLPLYLFLFFLRPEFDRYARYNSWGIHMREYLWLIISDIKKYRYKNNRCKKQGEKAVLGRSKEEKKKVGLR